MKKIFNRLTGGRFIRIDGQPYHQPAWLEWLTGPESKSAAAAFAAVNLYQTVLSAVPSGAELTSRGIMLGCFALLLRGFHGMALMQSVPYRRLQGHAIDREGRAIPPENYPSVLQSVEAHRDHQLAKAQAIGAVVLLAAASSIGGAQGKVSMPEPDVLAFFATLMMWLPRPVAAVVRANRILSGEYRIAGTPPPKKVKQRAGAFVPGGALAPK